MNKELAIARELRKTAREARDKQLLADLIRNPVFEIVTAYLCIEYAERRGWVGNIAATVAEGGCLTAVAFQQLQPYMKDIIQATESGISALGGFAPLLGAGALIPGLPPAP